ncbi:MAG TPA: tripartite tricarboxylate transporter TctB family protein [Fimbriimonas sp.]|jgi:putative tricarboxylic transport membrane protein|nr:tripartite tricarboxylate transporter TctB family protein [Fimbriimonas sp.]
MTEEEQLHADHAPEDREHPLVSARTMEYVTSLSLLALAATVIWDSTRIGFGWIDGQGPAPGFFPFIVASLLAFASIANIIRVALHGPETKDPVFVTAAGLGRVLSVLIPVILYVAAINYLGIYVASGIFVALFMIVIGREPIWKALAIGATLPLVLFLTFEQWFRVPLPKGPLETWLGY